MASICLGLSELTSRFQSKLNYYYPTWICGGSLHRASCPKSSLDKFFRIETLLTMCFVLVLVFDGPPYNFWYNLDSEMDTMDT